MSDRQPNADHEFLFSLALNFISDSDSWPFTTLSNLEQDVFSSSSLPRCKLLVALWELQTSTQPDDKGADFCHLSASENAVFKPQI